MAEDQDLSRFMKSKYTGDLITDTNFHVQEGQLNFDGEVVVSKKLSEDGNSIVVQTKPLDN